MKTQRLSTQSKLFISLFVVAVLFVSSMLIPIPFYIEQPGSAQDVQNAISVDGQKNTAPGAYLMTTVSVQEATPATYLLAKVMPYRTLVSKKEYLGELTDEEDDALGNLEMLESEYLAKKVALNLAKIPYKETFTGINVMGILPESDFYNKLKIGDQILKVDGQNFNDLKELMAYLSERKEKDTVTLSIKRQQEEQEVSGTLVKMNESHQVGIGISLTEASQIELDRNIQFDLEDVGGPSAGLVFTLELYELLTKESFREGKKIAGTGTIASDGKVGMIGGVDKKVVAADRAGAEIFFVPSEDFSKEAKEKNPDLKNNAEIAQETAKELKTKMKIVPVASVKEALAYLKK